MPTERAFFHWRQPLLLEMANTPEGQGILRLPNIPPSETITLILPHMFQVQTAGRQWVSELHINPVYANSIRWRWKEFCEYAKWLEEQRYNQTVERAIHLGIPASVIRLGLMVGTETIVYPDPDPESTSVDGTCGRHGQDDTWANVRDGDGTTGEAEAASREAVQIKASTTSGQYDTIRRGVLLFDGSDITDSDTIDSAVFAFDRTTLSNGLSGDAHDNSRVVLVESNPASDTDVVAADFQSTRIAGTTSFGESVTQENLGTDYNNITLNASGLANISKTAVSKFAVRYKWDFGNSETGLTWSSGARMAVGFNWADQTGTSTDPKLTIQHSAAGVAVRRKMVVY